MKYVVNFAFVCLMAISVYALFKEAKLKQSDKPSTIRKEQAVKVIEKKSDRNLSVRELQKKQSNEATVYKFESDKKDNNFEMDEGEMDSISRGMNGMRDARDAGQMKLNQHPSSKK